LKSIKQVLVVILSLSAGIASADIGKITSHEGSGEVIRKDSGNLVASLSLVIHSYDDVRTGNGKLEITFRDDSTVKLSANSKLVIDEFVFDPNPKKSKMAFKVAAGTARFATGKLGLVDKNKIKIRTPTATIGIRGTDFTTTVDEIGRSLVVLLPDADGVVGEVVVESLVDSVVLNEAFQATMVSTAETSPSEPVILEMNDRLMSELFIEEVEEEVEILEEQEYEDNTLLDHNHLDEDIFEEELEEDIGEEDLRELEKLFNDLKEKEEEKSQTFTIKGTSIGLDPVTKINTIVTDRQVMFERKVNNTVRLKLDKTGSYSVTLREDGEPVTVVVGSGESNIHITQQQ
jgi:hypothetical protein